MGMGMEGMLVSVGDAKFGVPLDAQPTPWS